MIVREGLRAHYFQHVPFEGIGCMSAWLVRHRYEVTATRLYEEVAFPPLANIDLLIIMGGPMSVNDEAEHPWLREEKAYIRAAIQAGKAVLGVCLGAQLIASAMGARVYKNACKEIGWFPIVNVAPSTPEFFQFPASMDVFHWHGETFDLPEGAVHLVKSEGCLHQAFQLGDSVMGLQFHLEMTPEAVESMMGHCGDELVAGQYIQAETDMRAAGEAQYALINRTMAEVLAFLEK